MINNSAIDLNAENIGMYVILTDAVGNLPVLISKSLNN